MLSKFKKNYIDNNRYIFIIVSILFGLCFLVQHTHGDDFGPLHSVTPFNFVSIVKLAFERSEHTFNRFLAYLICITVNSCPLYVFVITMMFAMYILLNALRVLFSKNNKYEKYLNVLITFLVMTYSYSDMASAGWIITSTMHFLFVALVYTSLIPIKKMFNSEKFHMYELVLYAVILVFASNMEQGMAFTFVCYTVSSIYFLVKKRNNKSFYVLPLISIICAIITVVSRIGTERSYNEIVKYMPTIGMLNIVDRIENGLSSSLYWLFFENHFFTIVVFAIFTLFIFVKYKNWFFRILSILPEILIICLKGYMGSNVSVNAFEIKPIELGSSNYGLINLISLNNSSTYIQYFVYVLLIIITIVEIYLLIDKFEDLLLIMTVLTGGFGSRMALALTPNIYISHFRTCIYFAFAIIVIGIKVYQTNINCLKEKYNKYLNYVYLLGIIVMLMYTFAYIYNYMGSSLFELFK